MLAIFKDEDLKRLFGPLVEKNSLAFAHIVVRLTQNGQSNYSEHIYHQPECDNNSKLYSESYIEKTRVFFTNCGSVINQALFKSDVNSEGIEVNIARYAACCWKDVENRNNELNNVPPPTQVENRDGKYIEILKDTNPNQVNNGNKNYLYSFTECVGYSDSLEKSITNPSFVGFGASIYYVSTKPDNNLGKNILSELALRLLLDMKDKQKEIEKQKQKLAANQTVLEQAFHGINKNIKGVRKALGGIEELTNTYGDAYFSWMQNEEGLAKVFRQEIVKFDTKIDGEEVYCCHSPEAGDASDEEKRKKIIRCIKASIGDFNAWGVDHFFYKILDDHVEIAPGILIAATKRNISTPNTFIYPMLWFLYKPNDDQMCNVDIDQDLWEMLNPQSFINHHRHLRQEAIFNGLVNLFYSQSFQQDQVNIKYSYNEQSIILEIISSKDFSGLKEAFLGDRWRKSSSATNQSTQAILNLNGIDISNNMDWNIKNDKNNGELQFYFKDEDTPSNIRTIIEVQKISLTYCILEQS